MLRSYTAYMAVEPLNRKMEETGMTKLFREIEMPLVFTLYEMEQAGIHV